MNKKLFLGVVATTGMLFATSCSSDDLVKPAGEEGLVTFTVSAEGANGSRTISDGAKANKLVWSVYDKDGALLPALCGEEVIEGNFLEGHDVTLRLAKGQTYTVAFWAQDSDCEAYEINNNDLKTVKVNGKHFNDATDCGDAFCRTVTLTVASDMPARPIFLYRPFAQVNVGVSMNEWEAALAAGQTVSQTAVTMKQVATKLNVVTGEVSEPVDFVCGATDILDDILFVDADGNGESEAYKWLSTCYVLPYATPAGNSTTVSAEYTISGNGAPITLSAGLENMPIQRNYRTNIVGNLLTSDVKLTIAVDNSFQNPDKNIVMWDGVTTEEPALVDGVYKVSSAAQWAWFGGRQVANDIELVGEINFGGYNAPILFVDKPNFVLNGNGHSIKNAKYVNEGTLDAYKMGLMTMEGFGGGTFTVKNLTIDNVVSVCNDREYGFSSALIADVQNNANVTIDGVTVCNSEIIGTQSLGGLVGFLPAGSTVTVKNSTVKDNVLYNNAVEGESGYVCGVVGKVAGTLNVDNTVVVEGNTIDAYFSLNRGPKSIDAVAAVRGAGVINGTATVNNNVVAKRPMVEADILLGNKNELLYFAQNYQSSVFKGKTVALVADIDLTGVDWNPIGTSVAACYCTFNGCGFTISNLTVTEKEGVLAGDGVGFFGFMYGSVKNLNFENVKVTGHHDVAVVAGWLHGSVENCTVNKAELNCTKLSEDRDGDKCGVLVGYLHPESPSVIKDCKISNSTVKAGRDAGQGVGACTDATIVDGFSGNEVSNVTVQSNGTGTGANINNTFVGRQ